jgi:hypothetical protein
MAITVRPPSGIIISGYPGNDSDVKQPVTWQQSSDVLPPEVMAQLTLGAIGGSELIKLTTHDRVQGERVPYAPIADVDIYSNDFKFKGLINYAKTLNSYRRNFNLDINSFYVEDSPSYPNSVATNSKKEIFAGITSTAQASYVETTLETKVSSTQYTTSNSLATINGSSQVSSINNTYMYVAPKTNRVGVLSV